jgi:hypothetical protein
MIECSHQCVVHDCLARAARQGFVLAKKKMVDRRSGPAATR